MALHDADRMRRDLAGYNAHRHMALYRREPVGLLVWKAFLEYRQAGQPVPEIVLSIIEAWAEKMVRAKDDHQLAAAMESGTVRSKTAHQRMLAAERNRDVMEHLSIREHELGQSSTVATREVAAQFGMTIGSVKTLKSRWRNGPSPQDQEGSTAGSELQATWLQQPEK